MKRWEKLVESYLQQCRTRGLAESTLKNRERELDRWGTWLRKRRPRPQLENISMELLVRYIAQRGAFRGKSTLASSISNMRCFGEYLVRESVWLNNPLKWIQGPRIDFRRQLPVRLSKETMRGLWEAAVAEPRKYLRSLYLATLGLLYGTGIRRSELVSLEMDSYHRDSGSLKIKERKTGREREVLLPELTRECLEEYLISRYNNLQRLGIEREERLLVSSRGTPLRGVRILNAVKRLAKRAGFTGRITLHQFRHTCASDLLDAGVGLCQVQRILGHRNLATTYRYTQVSGDERQLAVAQHPINRMLAV